MYDFILLVTHPWGAHQRARAEILALLGMLGDDRPAVRRTLARGVMGVKTILDPRGATKGLRALYERDPLVFNDTCTWLPVDLWVSAEVETMRQAIDRLRDRIGPGETWRMTLERRRYTRHHQLELIRLLAEPVTAKVDLVHPDKILRVDVLGGYAAISVLTPNDVFSVARPGGGRVR